MRKYYKPLILGGVFVVLLFSFYKRVRAQETHLQQQGQTKVLLIIKPAKKEKPKEKFLPVVFTQDDFYEQLRSMYLQLIQNFIR